MSIKNGEDCIFSLFFSCILLYWYGNFIFHSYSMRKIVSFCVLISLVSTIISPVFAITTTNDSIDVSDPLSDSGKYMAPMSGVKKIVPQIHYPQ